MGGVMTASLLACVLTVFDCLLSVGLSYGSSAGWLAGWPTGWRAARRERELELAARAGRAATRWRLV
jgi:hypothetical protein